METENVSIRDATVLDIPAYAAMIAKHEFGEIKYWRDHFEIDLANPQRRFLVARLNDEVVGYGHTT